MLKANAFKKPLLVLLGSSITLLLFQNCGPIDVESIRQERWVSSDTDSLQLASTFDPFVQEKLKDSCFDLVWEPTERDLATSSKRFGTGKGRTRYRASGPNGKPSLVSYAGKGQPAALSTFQDRNNEVMKRKSIVARIETKMFIPKGHGFNLGNAKIPLGLWGGDPDVNGSNGGICATAGCPPSRQTGFSLRLTRNLLNEKNFKHGPRLYSYHLNRTGVTDRVEGLFYMYGEGIPMNTSFPLNQWVKIVIDLRLNSFKNGVAKNNGTVSLYMYKMNGSLVGQVHKNGLVFRKDPSWHIFGPLLADLWGGPYKNDNHQPLKTFNT